MSCLSLKHLVKLYKDKIPKAAQYLDQSIFHDVLYEFPSSFRSTHETNFQYIFYCSSLALPLVYLL